MKRRYFIDKTSRIGLGYCSLMFGSNICTLAASKSNDKPDPAALNYCGYQCPKDCQFLKGTLENNIDLKKEAYELWEIKERFNVDFDPEKIFCFGCKTKDKPLGVVLTHCTVRGCAIEKELDCCIECNELVTCKKDLWERFPDFKKLVIEMQKEYNKI